MEGARNSGRKAGLQARPENTNPAAPPARSQMRRTFSSTSAATGRQLKQSVNVFHSRMLYRRLHSS